MSSLQYFRLWFEKHNKIEGEKKAEWVRETVATQTFYFSYCLVHSYSNPPKTNPVKQDFPISYKMILGYAVVNGVLQARAWYFSGSEATWRAFTGWRVGGEWMKGAEGVAVVADDLGSIGAELGYVYECYTTVDMNNILQGFYEQVNGQNLGFCIEGLVPFDYTECKVERLNKQKNRKEEYEVDLLLPPLVDRDMYKFLVGDYATESEVKKAFEDKSTKRSGIGEVFNSQANREYYRYAIPGIAANSKADENTYSNSVKIQTRYGVDLKNRMRIGVGHELKRETGLSQWLLSCLENGSPSERSAYHPVLGQDYIIRTYVLPPPANEGTLHVEIATTRQNVFHTYVDFSGAQKTVQTPICWIRDVYYRSSPINSFGTRKVIPLNLAFLVQKPCDYGTQVSKYYLEKTASSGKEIAGKYTNLSLLNEATSPLVKAFKDKMNYPRFRSKYIPNKISLEKRLDYLQYLILLGIKEYGAIRNGTNDNRYNTKGHHGSDGATRATDLAQAVKESQTIDALQLAMYNCFSKNDWFNKIRTNETSLFTCVCRHLLSEFIDDGPAPAQVVRNSAPQVPHGQNAGNAKCLNRMVNYIIQRPLPAGTSRERYITDESANLLNALKASRG